MIPEEICDKLVDFFNDNPERQKPDEGCKGKESSEIVLTRKDVIFSYIDAILIYYYMVLGLQADSAFKFVEHYWKKYSTSTQRFYGIAHSIRV